MDSDEKVEALKRLIELSEYFKYDDTYKRHVKKVKKEIKRLGGDKRVKN